ncbi:MAG: hypothetical protein JWL82_516, partial [Parcubacteria group bacterium]|nr:hypothetical protein [Parcubacteria group bacterium]
MHFLQRFAPAFFIGLCIVSGSFAVFPTAARAQLPVTDIAHITVSSGNALQNTITAFTAGKQVLNPIFWRLAQTAIQSTVNSTVKWINSGFNGSPAYASDLSNSLLRAGDTEANRFIADFQKNASINSPFRDAVAQNVLRAYYLSTSKDGFYLQNPYTLNKVSPDDAAFIAGEFTKGGLSAWLSLSGNCSNNPICAHDQAQRALNAQVISVQGKLAQEVANGNGFFSFHGKCKSSAPAAAGAGKVGVALSNSDDCLNQPIQTPGTVIANQLNKALGLGSDSLIQAHSFDEIVNALLGQLMKNVLGDSGLGGLSKGSASTGGRPYFDQSVSSTDST